MYLLGVLVIEEILFVLHEVTLTTDLLLMNPIAIGKIFKLMKTLVVKSNFI